MAKKNLSQQSPTCVINNAMGFTYPKAHYGKKIYVDFYAFDPATDKMIRFKRHFDSIKKKTEREKAIAHYIGLISDKLRQGWNPNYESGNKGLTTIEQLFDRYETTLSQYSRQKTQRDYRSRLNGLREYIRTQKFPPKYAYQINAAFCMDFLDWLVSYREVSARTRNNYRTWMYSLCDWLHLRGFIEKNPIPDIPMLREDVKKRKALSADQLKLVEKHLQETDRWFLFAVMFEYYTFIRPNELSHLKIGDISLKDRCIYVGAAFSKNRHDGTCALNPTLIKMMLDLGIFKYPSKFYLFGKGFKPSDKKAHPNQFNRTWKLMREKLKMNNDLQFYSLKDSGIRDLANEKGIVIARDQARHTDISTTNKYLSGRDRKGPEAAKDFEGAFHLD